MPIQRTSGDKGRVQHDGHTDGKPKQKRLKKGVGVEQPEEPRKVAGERKGRRFRSTEQAQRGFGLGLGDLGFFRRGQGDGILAGPGGPAVAAGSVGGTICFCSGAGGGGGGVGVFGLKNPMVLCS